jgi:hypothetical protein
VCGIDLVDDDLEVQRMRAFNQGVEVGDGPEDRVHAAIIGNVVAEIAHGRSEEGRKPDRIHAEARDIVELLRDAG